MRSQSLYSTRALARIQYIMTFLCKWGNAPSPFLNSRGYENILFTKAPGWRKHISSYVIIVVLKAFSFLVGILIDSSNSHSKLMSHYARTLFTSKESKGVRLNLTMDV